MYNSINKLFTNEDKNNNHKILGLYVLINYLFQNIYYFVYGNTLLNIWSLLPHFLLHISSFQFNVLKERVNNRVMAMFIWEELRAHSMIFSFRALFTILFPEFRIPIMFSTMILADIITSQVGNSSFSTVRGNHNRTTLSLYKRLASSFFSMSQMGATIICGGFFQNKWSPMLVFSTLPPIQTSAFGMTLIRKGIIDKSVWQYVYTIELLYVYLIWYLETNNLYIIPLSAICFTLRTMNISKYQIFATLFIINNICNSLFDIVDHSSSIDSFEYQ